MKRIALILITMIILWGYIFPLKGAFFDQVEYKTRRAKLMKAIPDGVALIVGADGPKQNSNFIYFTGIEVPRSILIINGIKKESVLFLPVVKSVDRIKEETGIERIAPVSGLSRHLYHIQSLTNIIYTPFNRDDALYQTLGSLDPDNRPSRELNLMNQIRKGFPNFVFKDLTRAIGELRVIKSPAEIKVMRESARISCLAHIEVLRSAKPGMYEWELAALFEYTIKRLGGQGFGYEPIVPSDPKWYDSHYSENSRKIKSGEMVMPDVGGEYQYYVVDISATFPINGKFTPEQKRLNRIICAVEEAMRQVFRPRIKRTEMKAEIQKILSKKDIDMEKEGVYRIRGDHWIGLDVHDLGPPRDVILRPGMVLACDPAIKIRDKAGNVIAGVKIENTVLITKDGCENLTSLVPRTVEEIEKEMAEKGILDLIKETREKNP